MGNLAEKHDELLIRAFKKRLCVELEKNPGNMRLYHVSDTYQSGFIDKNIALVLNIKWPEYKRVAGLKKYGGMYFRYAHRIYFESEQNCQKFIDEYLRGIKNE